MTPPSRAAGNYLLSVLVVIYAFNLVDRVALGLVLQDIKLDLGLTDTELGLMSGIAFAIFYSVMGIPIARWADRGDRVRIIGLTTALWSAAVALCGVATTFWSLVAIRIIVGVGEAGCGPPAQSLIAGHFARAERPRAAAFYALGAPLGKVIGYFGAGWLNELYGWRLTFTMLGLPGVALALWAWLTLKEPRRNLQHTQVPDGVNAAQAAWESRPVVMPTQSLGTVITTLWRNVTFRHLLAGYTVLNFFIFGVTQWQPAFFMRTFGIRTGELGTWFAIIYGGAGLLGVYWGGRWASRHAHKERLHLKAGAVLYGVLGIISPFIYIVPNPYVSMCLLALAAFGYYSTFGPGVAAIQTLVPQRMRATAFAFLYLFVNLVGIGLGPLIVGVLSDAFSAWAGAQSLRFALIIVSPGYFWVAWHVWRASATVMNDVERVQRLEAAAVSSS